MTFLEALVFLALPLIGLGPIWFLAPFVLLRLAERRPQRLCRTQKAILLSYDDGARPGLTEKLADLLACYQVPATFFVMGHKVTNAGERGEDQTVQRLLRDEHEVGSNSYHHTNAWKISPWLTAQDLAAGIEGIRKQGVTIPYIARLLAR